MRKACGMESKRGQRGLGRPRFFLGCVAALGMGLALPVAGQEVEVIGPPSQTPERAAGPVVREIEVEYAGPKSVSKSVILSNMRTTVGQPYSRAGVEEDVRNLFATGLFANLRIYDEPLADGVKVVVIVQPKPVVKDVVLAGWSKINDKRLSKEVKTKGGDTLNEQQVAADAQALTALYQTKGFKDAQVSYKIDLNEESGRAIVTFNINEGVKQHVKAITFSGNSKIPSKELLSAKIEVVPGQKMAVFKTKKRNWLSWLFGTGVVKDEEFQEDLQRLRKYYQSQGYIDAEVKGVEFKETGPSEVEIVIAVFEGVQYKVGTVQLTGYALYSEDRIRRRMQMREGGIYSPQGLEADIKAVRDLYGEQGYVDCRVIPERRAAIESGRMDLVYAISEGPQGFVERIVIQGNNKTKDRVIRRELALAPGDVYNTIRADASKNRLQNLGYFSKVDISPQDTSIPSRKNMVVTVEEQRTGSFSFGAGFSSIDSILGFVELNQGNFDLFNWPGFIGAGQKFRIRAQYGAKRQDYVISFVEPWFLNQRLSLGVDAFYRQASYLSSVYDETRWGFNVKLAKALNQFLTARAVYKFESIGINNVDAGASEQIQDEAGTRLRSAIELGLTHDTRDSNFLSRKGHKVDVYGELAGGPLFGDTDIYKLGLEAQQFFNFKYDIILALQAAAAVVDTYSDTDEVPIFDRLFLGGSNTIRGFRFRDVGPKDEDGTPIGGGTMAYGNVEATFPILEKVRGALFVDGGFVNAAAYDFATDGFGLGAGVGIRLNLPVGPLRLDYGIPLMTDEYNDRGGQFHFNVGYQF